MFECWLIKSFPVFRRWIWVKFFRIYSEWSRIISLHHSWEYSSISRHSCSTSSFVQCSYFLNDYQSILRVTLHIYNNTTGLSSYSLHNRTGSASRWSFSRKKLKNFEGNTLYDLYASVVVIYYRVGVWYGLFWPRKPWSQSHLWS